MPIKARSAFHLLLLSIVAIGSFNGCGRKQDAPVPVHGKVLLDGQPLTKGGIATTTTNGRGAMGRIQPDGTFKLTTLDEGDGARVGTHKVAIAVYEGEATGPEGDHGKLLIPQRYTSPTSSDLTIEVTADGPNEPVLELSSK